MTDTPVDSAHEAEGVTMKSAIKRLASKSRARNHSRSIRRTWDTERANAMSPSHRAEIDAIFARYL